MTATEVRNMVGAFLVGACGALVAALSNGGGELSLTSIVLAVATGLVAAGKDLQSVRKPSTRPAPTQA